MSLRSSEERRQRAAEEAAAWMLRLDSAEPDLATRAEFVDWLRESPVHVSEMLRMGSLQDVLADFQNWSAVSAEGPAASAQVVPLPIHRGSTVVAVHSTRRFSLKHAALLAASLAVVAISATLLFLSGSHDIQTQAGERRQIKLADGSFLEIAPDSALRLRMSRQERLVVLDRGEALFHVAKDPSRPFIVEAGQIRVRAVGTAFSVDRNAAAVVVIVAEGKVSITPPANPSVVTSRDDSRREIALTANEQVTIDNDGAPTVLRAVDSRAELAWARGVLIFDGDTVAEVVRRFNLANRQQIRILDPALAARPVSGVFDTSDPQSFVAFLESAAGVAAVQKEREILVGARSDQPSTVPPASR